jgi:hypothetical protein
MEYNILYNIKLKKIELIEPEDIIDKIYLLEYKVPSHDELNTSDKHIKKIINTFNNKDDFIEEIKKYISNLEYKIPLFDIYTSNIYLINRENIFKRVNYNHYRFPNSNLIKELENEYKTYSKTIKMSNNSKLGDISDPIEQRKIKKYELMIDFMKNFNLNILEDTYYRMIYKYSEEYGKNIIFCKRPSFNKYIHNTKPYYSSTEIINLALNMGIKVNINDKNFDLEKLCVLVRENDINYKTIQNHQKYIIESDMLGICQYYTVQGSFFINSYLRGFVDYPYTNTFLNDIIIPMWNLCNNAPEFDKDYILYRFIKNDKHLEELNIGDIFQDDAFLSTTRDPFYKSEEYEFGFILMKIKIPKNKKGVALCIETVSHFQKEQEILFSPKTKFKLISRDKNTVYYHTDPNFSSKVTTRYEFEWVDSEKPEINKINYTEETDIVNFLEIKSIDTLSLEEKVKYFINKYADDMNRIYVKIGDKKFLTCIEKYNSIGAYKDFYAIETKNGISFYSLYKNYLIFFIEIGETDKGYEMHVNYYVKYNTLNKEDIFSAEDFINFISSVAYYFNIENVAIYPEYKPCFISYKKSNKVDKVDKADNLKQLSGNYCVDFYKYLKNKEKRFFMKNINIVELKSLFNYYDLDLLREFNPSKILTKTDDELYQLYVKTFILEYPNGTISDFFVWIVDNKCYLIESFISKLEKLYKSNNPFKKDIYVLNAFMYLYNKGIIKIYGGSNIDIDYKERKQYTIQSNEYRLDNNRQIP